MHNNKGNLNKPIVPDNNQFALIQNKSLIQELIEFIPEPCFFLFKDANDRAIINHHLVKTLNFHSLQEYCESVVNGYGLISKTDRNKIMGDIKKLAISGFTRTNKYNIIRKDGSSFKSIIYLKPIMESVTGDVYGYLGTLHENEKGRAYQIDRSLGHMFSDDKLIDEVIAVLDFKGNVIATNTKFYVIDFFIDFANNKVNLFNVIDITYQKLLSRRINLLRKGFSAPPTEYKLSNENGQTAYIEIYSKPAIYKDKKVIVSMIRDISTRKEIERKLLYAVVQTEEKERQRFAQDLHDELGPFLSGLKLYLNELDAKDTDSKRRKLLIDYLGEMTNDAVDKIRTLTSNLMPQNLIEAGLSFALEKLIDKLNKTGQIKISYVTKGNETGIEHSLIITLYRIILEMINNSLKHSGSDRISIKIVFLKVKVRLIYKDNGKGFNLDETIKLNKGIGLKSIISRVELFQGTYKFKRIEPHGIEFDLLFPLK